MRVTAVGLRTLSAVPDLLESTPLNWTSGCEAPMEKGPGGEAVQPPPRPSRPTRQA